MSLLLSMPKTARRTKLVLLIATAKLRFRNRDGRAAVLSLNFSQLGATEHKERIKEPTREICAHLDNEKLLRLDDELLSSTLRSSLHAGLQTCEASA